MPSSCRRKLYKVEIDFYSIKLKINSYIGIKAVNKSATSDVNCLVVVKIIVENRIFSLCFESRIFNS